LTEIEHKITCGIPSFKGANKLKSFKNLSCSCIPDLFYDSSLSKPPLFQTLLNARMRPVRVPILTTKGFIKLGCKRPCGAGLRRRKSKKSEECRKFNYCVRDDWDPTEADIMDEYAPLYSPNGMSYLQPIPSKSGLSKRKFSLKRLNPAFFQMRWNYGGFSFKSLALGADHACGVVDLVQTKTFLTKDLARLASRTGWKGGYIEEAIRFFLMPPSQHKAALAKYRRDSQMGNCWPGSARKGPHKAGYSRFYTADDPLMKQVDAKQCKKVFKKECKNEENEWESAESIDADDCKKSRVRVRLRYIITDPEAKTRAQNVLRISRFWRAAFDGQAVCWGKDMKRVKTTFKCAPGQKSVRHNSHYLTKCLRNGMAIIWKQVKQGHVTDAPKKLPFVSVVAGWQFSCGILKGSQHVKCWGKGLNQKIYKIPKRTAFSSISGNFNYVCGIIKGTTKSTSRQLLGRSKVQKPSSTWNYRCWGSYDDETTRHYSKKHGPPKNASFKSISAGQRHTCGVLKSGRGFCWGNGGNEMTPKQVLSSISAGFMYNCAIVKATQRPFCWPGSGNTINRSTGKMRWTPRNYHENPWCLKKQCTVPTITAGGYKWGIESTCHTSHPQVEGPASCTSCSGCNKFFTVADPKTNTGTCTKRECPMCKPKVCCGKRHKHYVYNTESMEGVCVPHNDDCTAVCMPRHDDGTKKRVCSKGCNIMLKTPKRLAKKLPKDASSEDAEQALNDIVVCQVDRRIVCNPWKKHAGGKKNSHCKTSKAVAAVARCSFKSPIWNVGGTCITHLAHGEQVPNCPTGTTRGTKDDIRKSCKALTTTQERVKNRAACSVLTAFFAEYY